MKHSDVTVVRIYLTEGEKLLKTLLAKLHDDEQVRGVTVFRGISGFGRSGMVHSSTLLDLSLDLPVVVEFFDTPAKVKRILGHLKDLLPPWWPGRSRCARHGTPATLRQSDPGWPAEHCLTSYSQSKIRQMRR